MNVYRFKGYDMAANAMRSSAQCRLLIIRYVLVSISSTRSCTGYVADFHPREICNHGRKDIMA